MRRAIAAPIPDVEPVTSATQRFLVSFEVEYAFILCILVVTQLGYSLLRI